MDIQLIVKFCIPYVIIDIDLLSNPLYPTKLNNREPLISNWCIFHNQVGLLFYKLSSRHFVVKLTLCINQALLRYNFIHQRPTILPRYVFYVQGQHVLLIVLFTLIMQRFAIYYMHSLVIFNMFSAAQQPAQLKVIIVF